MSVPGQQRRKGPVKSDGPRGDLSEDGEEDEDKDDEEEVTFPPGGARGRRGEGRERRGARRRWPRGAGDRTESQQGTASAPTRTSIPFSKGEQGGGRRPGKEEDKEDERRRGRRREGE